MAEQIVEEAPVEMEQPFQVKYQSKSKGRHRADTKLYYPLSIYIRILKNRYYGFWLPALRQRWNKR